MKSNSEDNQRVAALALIKAKRDLRGTSKTFCMSASEIWSGTVYDCVCIFDFKGLEMEGKKFH